MSRRPDRARTAEPAVIRKPKLRSHAFYATAHRGQDGTPICHCGSLKSAAIHRVREQTNEQRAEEARRTGESA